MIKASHFVALCSTQPDQLSAGPAQSRDDDIHVNQGDDREHGRQTTQEHDSRSRIGAAERIHRGEGENQRAEGRKYEPQMQRTASRQGFVARSMSAHDTSLPNEYNAFDSAGIPRSGDGHGDKRPAGNCLIGDPGRPSCGPSDRITS